MNSTIQSKGLKRNTIDKFYTKDIVVKKCIDSFKKNISLGENDIIIEPSAGNGAFIQEIKNITKNYFFYDIQPENSQIIQLDYLNFNLDLIKNTENTKNIHLIGNPPFGRQSSLAIKFIKKSCEYCNSISFILPKSFKKESLQKHFTPYFHLLFEFDIPDNSFIVNDNDYNVPCVFQIWEKKISKRKIIEKIKPENFKFVKKNEDPDISFRRVGVYAGKIDKETENKSIQSHYFIKFDKQLSDAIYQKLQNINYESKNNTVGPKSISKPELIKEFNLIMSFNP